MAKGKKKGKRGDSSDEEDVAAPEQEANQLSRKELRKLKKAGKNDSEPAPQQKPAAKKKGGKRRGDSTDEDVPEPEPEPEPVAFSGKKGKKKSKRQQQLDEMEAEMEAELAAEQEAEQEEPEPEPAPAPAGGKKKKKSKKQQQLDEMEAAMEAELAAEQEAEQEDVPASLPIQEIDTSMVDTAVEALEDLSLGAEGEEQDVERSHKASKKEKKSKEKKEKKMSNKQRRELAKQAALDETISAIESASNVTKKSEGEQFSYSAANQRTVDDNSKDIVLEDFNINAHGKELFVNASLKIIHGHRYGLVGPNGQGKTTLLTHLAKRVIPVPKHLDMHLVEQEFEAGDTPSIDAVIAADTTRTKLLAEQERISEQMEGDLEMDEQEALSERMKTIVVELESINAASIEARARRILNGLGFTTEMQANPTSDLSGGWRMRISLARALLMEPTLLMLDEPTNHLDLNAVIWLDSYLQKWKNTLLVVSHDQDFLDSVCTDMIHLDQKQLFYYRGNYERFKKMLITKRKEQENAWIKYEKSVKAAKSKGVNKKDAEDKARSQSRRSEAKSKKKGNAADEGSAAATAKEQIVRPRDYVVHFEFPEPPELTPPILEVNDIGFHYTRPDGTKCPQLFDQVNFGVTTASRISIVGPNGVGKSTLLKLLMGELEPTSGEVRQNRHLRIGKYNQHFVDKLPVNQSGVEYLMNAYTKENLGEQRCRQLLGRFGLEAHAHKIPMRDLSGGQKARVQFLNCSLSNPHILFLDEPTNHLDIESIDALAEALREFDGGVVLVSHDARLITEVECDLWVCDERDCFPYDGDLDDYRAELLRKLEGEEDEGAEAEDAGPDIFALLGGQ